MAESALEKNQDDRGVVKGKGYFKIKHPDGDQDLQGTITEVRQQSEEVYK